MNEPVSDYFSVPGHALPDIIDLRGLEAPEPMEKILLACAQLALGGSYLARLPHVPAPLFPHLETRGLDWQMHETEDGSALILIRRSS